ncbi:hypothetical protein DPX16_11352 [Anabarilius grahami]|uniref:Uncharacterized protein n=1 Tax=Anabarilius grahami TaxID=495550 RepID=A0A3N0XII0_ANAGA|nr:hypothetical protein DPX16_11352 [Anabarilius grahami]
MEALVGLDGRHDDYCGSDLSSLPKCTGTAFTNTQLGGEEWNGRRRETATPPKPSETPKSYQHRENVEVSYAVDIVNTVQASVFTSECQLSIGRRCSRM